jgi:twinkle protein
MNIKWEKYGIDTSKVVGGKTHCPKCSHTRKNKRDRSLSVDLKSGLFNCHNAGCEFRGCAVEIVKEKRVYVKPPARLEKLQKAVIDNLEKERGISNNTLLRFGITESKEWMPQFEKEVTCICFNYYRGEDLVNIKFRGPKKSFKLAKDAELIFYNINNIQGAEEIVIVEGEMDCLTLHECGVYNVVSVPNGASMGNQKLEYLDNCWEFFEGAKKIVLAVDGDTAGDSLREELARRLGKERCYLITYPEGCKDANEVLMKYGKEAVVQMIDSKREWPIDGIIQMDEMYSTICNWYENGYPKGARARIDGLDELITFVGGQVTTITGIPGHGKDEYTNWIMTNLARYEQWSWGVCGFEEEAEQTATKIVEKYIGKSFDFRKDPSHRITVSEFEQGIFFVDKYFHFYKTEAIDTDIDALLEIADRLVVKYGIKGLILNPWNWIDNMSDEEGTDYVSWAYSRIIRFARKRGVHVFIIAHTTKMPKDKITKKYEVPTLYSISGSAHFYNKTHNGITVYRDDETVDIYVQKVKQHWLGQKGFSTYKFNTFTRQYEFLSSSANSTNMARLIPMRDITEPKTKEIGF